MATTALTLIEAGHELLLKSNFSEAEECFLAAIAVDRTLAMAHNNLGWTYERLGKQTAAVSSYRSALSLNADLTLAKVNLSSLLGKMGHAQEAIDIWNDLIESESFDKELINEAIDGALAIGNLSHASRWAEICADYLRGSDQYPIRSEFISRTKDNVSAMLTSETLTHDLEQIKYLRSCGVSDIDFETLTRNYECVLTSMVSSGSVQRRPLSDDEQELIGDTYGRIWHLRKTPRIESASLWGNWDPKPVESEYLNSPLGLCVIDDFLSTSVVNELRHYCMESTVWFANHYAHGRLGAFFREGFSCPLLVQIASELRYLFPKLIESQHQLLQLWGFKYSHHQPITHAHADFAAVNLNFWLTPEEANLNKYSGGLMVYNVEAPLDWDHNAYNRNGREISSFLRQTGARSVHIPYRTNRAILFNSDLFHATAPLDFRQGYENRRLNITMLFGKRGEDSKRVPQRMP